jgi:hypothetical protein
MNKISNFLLKSMNIFLEICAKSKFKIKLFYNKVNLMTKTIQIEDKLLILAVILLIEEPF